MILTRQQSSARIHVIERDFKTEISNAFVTAPMASFREDAPLDSALAAASAATTNSV
jgi:hypothetical protein